MSQESVAREGASHAARALNKLILVCKDDILTAKDTARTVRDPGLKERLRDIADERALFVRDLDTAVQSLGGTPPRHTGAFALLRSVGRRTRALVAGWHEGDGYASYASAERRTARAYTEALTAPLDDAARFGVKQQLAAINTELAEATRMRGLH